MTIPFLILSALFCLLLAAFFFSVLVTIGYHNKYREAVDAANRNAGYWAEADSRASEAEAVIQQSKALIRKYDHVLAIEKKRGDDFQHIAHEALRAARREVFGRKSERELREMPWDEMQAYLRDAQERGIPMADGSTLRRDPDESYRVEIIDDNVLDAGAIDA